MRRKHIVWGLLVLFMVSVFAVGCGGGGTADQANKDGDKPKDSGKPTYINIATASTSGVYYAIGNALAKVWGDKIPNIKASAQSTAGSVNNMDLLQKKEAELAVSQAGVAYEAFNGKGKWEGNPVKIKAIGYLYPNPINFVARKDANITSLTQMKGKRFVPGDLGSATEVNAKEILTVGYGYKYPEDFKIDFVNNAQAADMMSNRQIDVAHIAGDIPHSAIVQMTSSIDCVFLPVDADAAKKVIEKYPWYYEFTLPAGAYKGLDQDVKTLSVANILVVREDLPEDLVYELTKAMYESTADIEAVHKSGRSIKAENATNGVPIPFHPGAEKYLKEKGVIK